VGLKSDVFYKFFCLVDLLIDCKYSVAFWLLNFVSIC